MTFTYRPLPKLRAAYSDRTAALMAHMCRLAYLPFESDPAARRRLDAVLASQDFVLLSTFAGAAAAGAATPDATSSSPDAGGPSRHGVEGFFTAHRYGHLAVLAFRGTTDDIDWRVNLQFQRESIQVGRDARRGEPNADTPEPDRRIRVHRGFFQAYQAVHDQIAPHMAQFWADHPRTPVYITGHSLGGALAQIATAHFTSDQIAACYTFGGPRVAERDFDTVVKSPLYRVVNGYDLVPKLPWRLLGYCHTGDVRRMLPGEPIRLRRRDLGTLSSIVTDFVGMGLSALRRRFLGVDDHDIETYVRRLEAHARSRETLTQTLMQLGADD